jgi:predicted glycosyltransferase
MRQIVSAREYDRTLTFPLVMILGPFMAAEEREEIRARARRLTDVTVLDFESQIETIMVRATAIVSMGGYNTFCEILSFDKRALLVPRSRPRREQHIRAARAAELGLVDMLDAGAADDPRLMARALRGLPTRLVPSQRGVNIDLNGLETIGQQVACYIDDDVVPLHSAAKV